MTDPETVNGATTGLRHDETAQRFIGPMSPNDAFVSYVWQGTRMVMTHIEVDPSLRGTGAGARFATQVLNAVKSRPHDIRLTCPFLRKVAATRADWRAKFDVGA